MHEPIVFVVDEDPRALAGLTSALQRRFGGDYRILADGDPGSAEVTLAEACDGGEVTMVVDIRDRLDFDREPFIIPGALHLQTEELEARHAEIPRDRDIILYCT